MTENGSHTRVRRAGGVMLTGDVSTDAHWWCIYWCTDARWWCTAVLCLHCSPGLLSTDTRPLSAMSLASQSVSDRASNNGIVKWAHVSMRYPVAMTWVGTFYPNKICLLCSLVVGQIIRDRLLTWLCQYGVKLSRKSEGFPVCSCFSVNHSIYGRFKKLKFVFLASDSSVIKKQGIYFWKIASCAPLSFCLELDLQMS